jgi:hypothetical protein
MPVNVSGQLPTPAHIVLIENGHPNGCQLSGKAGWLTLDRKVK